MAASSATGGWVQLGETIFNTESGDETGHSVAMSADGRRIAVGSSRVDAGVDDPDVGEVRVYDEPDPPGGPWILVGVIPGRHESEQTGSSVAMSANGKRVAIGAVRGRNGSTPTGDVRVFEQGIEGAWTQVGTDMNGAVSFGNTGWSVAMSADGTRVAVGSISETGLVGNAGTVRVFDEPTTPGGAWRPVGAKIDGIQNLDQTGSSVAMSADGTRVAVGSRSADSDGGLRTGNVQVYQQPENLLTGTWTPVGAKISGIEGSDATGTSVAMSADGRRVAVGSPFATQEPGVEKSGDVRIYDEPEAPGGHWRLVGAAIYGGRETGCSVALSADGKRVAVGAMYASWTNPETATYVDSAGEVRVYDEPLTAVGPWVPVGEKLNGSLPIIYGTFGFSVAMSAVGGRVVVGAVNQIALTSSAQVFEMQAPPSPPHLPGRRRPRGGSAVAFTTLAAWVTAVCVALCVAGIALRRRRRNAYDREG
jgi:hypothetical protein